LLHASEQQLPGNRRQVTAGTLLQQIRTSYFNLKTAFCFLFEKRHDFFQMLTDDFRIAMCLPLRPQSALLFLAYSIPFLCIEPCCLSYNEPLIARSKQKMISSSTIYSALTAASPSSAHNEHPQATHQHAASHAKFT
jgi:hypothetical protein